MRGETRREKKRRGERNSTCQCADAFSPRLTLFCLSLFFMCVLCRRRVFSLGVGYELAYAEFHSKPILVLYRWPRPDNKGLSGMISGNVDYKLQTVKYYKDEEEAKQIMDEWINEWKASRKQQQK